MNPITNTSPDLSTVIENPGEISWFKIVLIVAIVFALRLAGRQLMYLLVDRAMRSQKYINNKERLQRRDTLVSVFYTLFTVLLVIVGITLILHELGVNIAAFITGIGALGVVLGVAGQSMIKDFLKGLSILFYDQMRVGDFVEIADTTGRVESISLQIVRLRSFDGDSVVVPNSEIGVVTNRTHGHANVNLVISASHDADVNLIEKLANQVGAELSADEVWGEKILEPVNFMRLEEFGEYFIKFRVFGKSQPGEQWAISGEFRRRLKAAFDKHGIKIAMPEHVLHNEKTKASK